MTADESKLTSGTHEEGVERAYSLVRKALFEAHVVVPEGIDPAAFVGLGFLFASAVERMRDVRDAPAVLAACCEVGDDAPLTPAERMSQTLHRVMGALDNSKR